jgi:hypothetical protein
MRSTPCTWRRGEHVSWLSHKTKSTVCQWFSLKIIGMVCQWFDLKTSGMIFSGLASKSVVEGFLICVSKPAARFDDLSLKITMMVS